MPDLPIRRIVLYKHGIGYFERRGKSEGTDLRLSFPREAMDDVLKSLIAIDLGEGQVRGVDFETPEDRAARLAKGSIHLSDEHSMLDLLRDLRGRKLRLEVREGSSARILEGLVIGIDMDQEQPLRRPFVSLFMPEQNAAQSLLIHSIIKLEILDSRAAEDLTYFLRASQSEEDRRAATLRLSEGSHDLLVGYTAPAPAWRVSYRVLAEASTEEQDTANSEASSSIGSQFAVLLQGWGLFDNQLDEDLNDVQLTLVAGMPVSFRYRLYEPVTPERPMIEDEQRTVAKPVEFQAMSYGGAAMPAAMAAPAPIVSQKTKRSRGMHMAAEEIADMEYERGISLDNAQSSTLPASVGAERGSLFQYRVAHPISVGRGQSAMVPIVGQKLKGRKELLYNPTKLARHPVASLRMRNTTGLTLERGPVTVLEESDYAGEAVLPFTRPGAELIVAYAVELGISIVEMPISERHIASIGIRNDNFILQEWNVVGLIYKIQSSLTEAVNVVIEAPEPPEYELFDTPTPTERAQQMSRWSVSCAPGSETVFSVRWRYMTSRREQIRGVGDSQLQDYLRNRFLDQATFNKLQDVLAQYRLISERQQRLQQIQTERQEIYQRQQQTQGSLGPLGREGDEGKLRGRYVALLEELENRLAALTNEERGIQTEIQAIEKRARDMLAVLSR